VKYVVGLGNPGREYADTRHNLGWMVVDRLAERMGAERMTERPDALTAVAGALTVIKPTTFMNDSGRAVARLAAAKGAGAEDILVVVDDLNLALGALRIRRGGSSGGHRGLESVAEWLATDAWARARRARTRGPSC